ncbi:hypothetical protein [Sphingomonas morindae]|uniref:Uncharacterized protein n=1 Tax=Sphingomonas morindae TaxID=1541170 RepID=A0ABY4X7J4_9SPHN|nr:hypothetical protein [Sphingomonas morindae]USI72912.1 hypothetical protein LHA26_00020 [Sphingomonas morindae]
MAIDIDIRENIPFERRWHKAELIAFGLMIVLLIAALAGLLGDSPFGKRHALFLGIPAYARFDASVRSQTPTNLDLAVGPHFPSDRVEVTLDRRFLASLEVKATSPRASAMRTGGDGVTYDFDLGPDRSGLITLQLTPLVAGRGGGVMRVQGHAAPISVFILP